MKVEDNNINNHNYHHHWNHHCRDWLGFLHALRAYWLCNMILWNQMIRFSLSFWPRYLNWCFVADHFPVIPSFTSMANLPGNHHKAKQILVLGKVEKYDCPMHHLMVQLGSTWEAKLRGLFLMFLMHTLDRIVQSWTYIRQPVKLSNKPSSFQYL